MIYILAIAVLLLWHAVLRQQRKIERMNDLVMDAALKAACSNFGLRLESAQRRFAIDAAVGNLQTEMHDRDNALETEMDTRNGVYANALARALHRLSKLERGA